MKGDSLISLWLGGFFAVVSYLLGGVDNVLYAVAIFMTVDYILGVLVGAFEKKISSVKAYRGVAKKIAMLLFIIVANSIDMMFDTHGGDLRNFIAFMIIGIEGISIVENLGKLGVPVPQYIQDLFEQLKGGKQ